MLAIQIIKKKSSLWVIKDPSDDELYMAVEAYLKEKKYYGKIFENPSRNRVTKVYTNGEVKIFLFNIKPSNFEAYLTLVKSFKYIN